MNISIKKKKIRNIIDSIEKNLIEMLKRRISIPHVTKENCS